jgi:hypothetical protein
VRYNANGTLDTTFGDTGVVLTQVGAEDATSDGMSVRLQADGKIVVAGSSLGHDSNFGGFAVARYNPDGSPDPEFGGTNSLGNHVSFTEDGDAVVLDAAAKIFDSDLATLDGGNGNYGGASVMLARTGGADADDVFGASGSLALAGTDVVLAGVTVGSFSQSNGQLVITFADGATQAQVNAVLDAITYANSNDFAAGTTTPIQIEWTFSDGNTGLQGLGGARTTAGITTVDVIADNAIGVALAIDSGTPGDGITNVGKVNLTGLTPGATWSYSTDGGAHFTAGTGASFTLSGDGPKNVLVQEIAPGNVISTATFSFTLDTSAAGPAVALATDSGTPGDGITKVGTVNVSGLEAGATWQYAVNGGAFVTGTGSSFTLTGDGPKTVLVHQTDIAGNTSGNTSLVFTLDTSAAGPAVALATDSGTPGDGITKIGTVNVSGLEAGATWEYAVNGGAFVAGIGSSFTLTGDGPKTVLVHQTDAAGNISGNSSLVFTLDTSAAGPAVALATDSGTPGDGITKVGIVNVSGLEAGATWQYAVNGGAFVTGTGSSFTLTGDGPKTVLVHQTDAAGNTSGNTSLVFTLDTSAAGPAVALATDSGTPGDGITKVGTVNVSGLEAGATWQYAVNGGAFVAGSGSSFTLIGDGTKTLLVHQTDIAGNISGNTALSLTLDTVTSDAITTAGGTVTNAAQTIQGTGEAGAKIQLLDGANPLGAAVTVDATGHWSSAVTLAGSGDHVIAAAATDIAGNTATSNAITLTLSNGDVVISEPGDPFVNGTNGNDHIAIYQGNVLVNAGNGDDVFSLIPVSKFAVHALNGGNGTDTLDLSATTTANSVDLSAGFATGSQIELELLISIEKVIGGSGNDTIVGSGVANWLDGGAGRDTIRAGNGNDTIIGGSGNDALTGGGGSDTFIFHPNFGKDIITDFQIGGATAATTHDVLDLRGLGFASIQDVLNHTDPGVNAVIHVGADDITLSGVTRAQLAAHQFDFLV